MLTVKTERAASKHWYDPGEGHANSTEVLFFALAICASDVAAAELDRWAKKAAADSARAEELRAAWKPLASGENGFAARGRSSALFDVVAAFRGNQWPAVTLDAIGVAMQLWQGDGSFDGLRSSDLKNYFPRPPPGMRASSKVSKRDAPARWLTWVITRVAALIKRHRKQLQLLLQQDVQMADVPTKDERLAAAEAARAAAAAALAKERVARVRAEDRARKAAARNKDAAQRKSAAVRAAKAAAKAARDSRMAAERVSAAARREAAAARERAARENAAGQIAQARQRMAAQRAKEQREMQQQFARRCEWMELDVANKVEMQRLGLNKACSSLTTHPHHTHDA